VLLDVPLFGALPLGGVSPGGAPPGAVLGGVAVGALDELAFAPLASGAVAGGVWSEGPPGAVDCCFEQPAASISAAIDSKTKLRFMGAPLKVRGWP
jgi:hypothetical protein